MSYRTVCSSCGYVLWGGTAEYETPQEAEDMADDANGQGLYCPDCRSFEEWEMSADDDEEAEA